MVMALATVDDNDDDKLALFAVAAMTTKAVARIAAAGGTDN